MTPEYVLKILQKNYKVELNKNGFEIYTPTNRDTRITYQHETIYQSDLFVSWGFSFNKPMHLRTPEHTRGVSRKITNEKIKKAILAFAAQERLRNDT